MLTFSLQSGSNGNAIYVEAAGTRLLFDAGINGVTAQRRMAVHGRDMQSVHAVIISHDHVDHVRYAGVWNRRFGIPVYITRPTLQATWCSLGKVGEFHYFNSGDVLQFGAVKVHTIRTAHDAADGVAFVVECEGKRLGIFTDLGHVFAELLQCIRSVDAAYVECNYDAGMLDRGPYPYPLKARIRGAGGHLSNDDAAGLLRDCGRDLPRWIAVAHLSEDNNMPELAIGAQHDAIGKDYPVHHASRHETSPIWSV